MATDLQDPLALCGAIEQEAARLRDLTLVWASRFLVDDLTKAADLLLSGVTALRRLVGERDNQTVTEQELRKQVATLATASLALRAEHEALRGEVTAAAKELLGFCDHDTHCSWHHTEVCDCGKSSAVRRMHAALTADAARAGEANDHG